MGITPSPEPVEPVEPIEPVQPVRPAWPSPGHASAFVTGGAYALVFVLGLLEGVIGAFQYSHGAAGSVPLGAIGFDLLILVTCGLAGWGMGSMAGSLLPAIGWFVAVFGLAMPDSGGSVIISNTHAGEWFLYGGSLCALLGVATALVPASRRPRRPRRPPSAWGRNRMAGGGVPPA